LLRSAAESLKRNCEERKQCNCEGVLICEDMFVLQSVQTKSVTTRCYIIHSVQTPSLNMKNMYEGPQIPQDYPQEYSAFQQKRPSAHFQQYMCEWALSAMNQPNGPNSWSPHSPELAPMNFSSMAMCKVYKWGGNRLNMEHILHHQWESQRWNNYQTWDIQVQGTVYTEQ
jgi:hypothetical protein